jgi:large subunit ribosomal protein L23
MTLIKPLMTEKAVKILEIENTILFEVDIRAGKEEIKKEIESKFNVKVEEVRTLIRKNKKIAYIKLKPESKAINIATKLGLM